MNRKSLENLTHTGVIEFRRDRGKQCRLIAEQGMGEEKKKLTKG